MYADLVYMRIKFIRGSSVYADLVSTRIKYVRGSSVHADLVYTQFRYIYIYNLYIWQQRTISIDFGESLKSQKIGPSIYADLV